MRNTSRLLFLTAAIALLASPALARPAVRAHVYGHRWWVGAAIPVRQTVVVRTRPIALVDFNVHPKTTKIYVDGSYRGICDEFDGYPQKMSLAPGRHQVRLVLPDGSQISRTIELTPGYELNLNIP